MAKINLVLDIISLRSEIKSDLMIFETVSFLYGSRSKVEYINRIQSKTKEGGGVKNSRVIHKTYLVSTIRTSHSIR